MHSGTVCAGDWLKLAPFRILSVDIECAGRKVTPPFKGFSLRKFSAWAAFQFF